MNAYWLVALLTMLLNKVLPSDNQKNYIWNLIVSFIPLFIYGAIRVDYGNDYSAYEHFFDIFHSVGAFVGDNDAHAEVGYQYLCYIMPSYRSILVLSAFLLSASYIYFIYRNIAPKYAWLVILLLFLMPEKNVFGSLVGIRNGLVVSSFLLTYTFVQERRYYIILPVAFLLSLIHTSALTYIPLAYLVARNSPVTRKEVYIWIAAGILLMLLSTSSIVGAMMPVITVVAGRYEEALADMNETSRGLLNYGANLIMMFAFLWFAFKQNNNLTPSQKSIFRMGALYCVSGCLGVISGRMTCYFALFYVASIVLMYSNLDFKPQIKRSLLVFVILIACYATFYVWMGSPWWNHAVYHSLLGDM